MVCIYIYSSLIHNCIDLRWNILPSTLSMFIICRTVEAWIYIYIYSPAVQTRCKFQIISSMSPTSIPWMQTWSCFLVRWEIREFVDEYACYLFIKFFVLLKNIYTFSLSFREDANYCSVKAGLRQSTRQFHPWAKSLLSMSSFQQ